MFYPRFLIALAAFLVASVYGICIAVVRRDRSAVAYDYARLMGRLMQPALGVRHVEVHGGEHLLEPRTCIYIANHQSYFDVPVFATVYPKGTVVIGKKEIRSIPFFGWLFATTGNIMIDRSDRARAVARLREVSAEVRRRGVSVWIFPEGTRGVRPGELLPFKKGAFQMAVAAQCPLVPIVLAPLARVIDAAERRIRPGTLEIRVLEPIPTAGLDEGAVDGLIAEAHARMSEALAEMAACGPQPVRASLEEPAGGGSSPTRLGS
jgi:1-acyl-sn-glycerol-3-phosphate acyltransferase